jgi:hypothetical protein
MTGSVHRSRHTGPTAAELDAARVRLAEASDALHAAHRAADAATEEADRVIAAALGADVTRADDGG